MLRLDEDVNWVPWDIDPDYVCDATDSALISEYFAAYFSRHERAADSRWLRILLNPRIPSPDVRALMRTLHVALEPLQHLAEAAFTDGLLAHLLARDADSRNSWLQGEVSLLHLLIGSSVAGTPPAEVAELWPPTRTSSDSRCRAICPASA